MWHAAEEGLRNCGQPACHSVSADLHTLPYHRAGDRQTETDGQTCRQAEMERKERKKTGGWVRGRERVLKAAGDSLQGLKM